MSNVRLTSFSFSLPIRNLILALVVVVVVVAGCCVLQITKQKQKIIAAPHSVVFDVSRPLILILTATAPDYLRFGDRLFRSYYTDHTDLAFSIAPSHLSRHTCVFAN